MSTDPSIADPRLTEAVASVGLDPDPAGAYTATAPRTLEQRIAVAVDSVYRVPADVLPLLAERVADAVRGEWEAVDAAPAVERAAIDISWIVAVSDDGNDVMAGVRTVLAALVAVAEQRERERIAKLRAAPAPGSVDHVWGVDAMGNRVAGFAREARATIRAIADSQSYRRGHIEEMAVRIIKGERS
jgi:hypothetical protein